MKNILSFLKKIVNNKISIFVWFFLIIFLSFGILIPTLGFFWDDLPYLYQYYALGPGGFPEYVSSDRPFSAWIFSATTAIFGYQSLGYHLLILALRWVCTTLFYLILVSLWPGKRTQNIIAASLFAIYPGFLQQPIALIYNHHFSVLALFLASIYLMVLNLEREKLNVFLTALSVLFSFSMFSIENFAMLELVRPFIIWKMIRQKSRGKGSAVTRSLLIWLPYLVVLLAFIIWRVFIFKFPTYKPAGVTSLLQTPFDTIAAILQRIPWDFYTVFIRAWAYNLNLPNISDFGRSATYLFYAVIVMMAGISIFFFLFLEPSLKSNPEIPPKHRPDIEQLLAAVLLFFLAGSILWGLDLPVGIQFAWDRMTLAFFPAVGLFGAFAFSFLRKKKIILTVIMTALLSLAVSQNYQNGIAFKRDWDNLQDFLTQLSWRIPSLAENTIFITSNPGLTYYSDNSLTSPINLLYQDQPGDNELSYFVYFTDARTEEWFENDLFNQDYTKGYRSFVFHGNTGNAITYRFEPPSCVQVFDRTYANSITTPNLTYREVKEIRFSNLDLVQQTPKYTPFQPVFKPSSTDNWCYFFESADLARQFGNYPEIVRLGNEAISSGKAPRTTSEWLPFLEGYIWEGDFDTTRMIISEINKDEGNYTPGMCYTMQRIFKNKMYPFTDTLADLIKENDCE